MFLHRSLVKAIVGYVLFLLIASLLFALVYASIAKGNGDKSPFMEWFYFSLMTFSTIGYDAVPVYPTMWGVVSLQFLLNAIATPIFVGIIFYYILNRPPMLVFPKRLILRRRTSEGSKERLTLAVKVANRHRHKLYDVTCRLLYSYYKPQYDGYNRETGLTDQTPYIDKTYRFSYEIERFPTTFLKTYLYKEAVNYLNDEILVIISGRYGVIGDPFIVERRYRFEDIELVKDTMPLYGYKRTDSGLLEKTKIDYSRLDRILPYTEDERTEINQYIKTVIDRRETEEQQRIAALTPKPDGNIRQP